MRTGFDSSAMADASWPGCAKSLKGVVLDLCGVLYDSGEGGGSAISGSVEALKKWVSEWVTCCAVELNFLMSVEFAQSCQCTSAASSVVAKCLPLLSTHPVLLRQAQGLRPAAALLHQREPGGQGGVRGQAPEAGLRHHRAGGLLPGARSRGCSQREGSAASPAGVRR